MLLSLLMIESFVTISIESYVTVSIESYVTVSIESYVTVSVERLLSEYEVALSQVMTAGVDIVTMNYTQNWDYLQSVFFSTTILTTIGSTHHQNGFPFGRLIKDSLVLLGKMKSP